MFSKPVQPLASFVVLARLFSTKHPNHVPVEFSTRGLIKRLTVTPKPKPPPEKLTFGTAFSDHMLEADWTAAGGWSAPLISPYHKLEIDPAASVLHYSLECFEGMKAYVDSKGRARLFRPELNVRRFNKSMARLGMPTIPEAEFLECLKQLVLVDKDWIPKLDGFSLYIRPTGIATHAALGVAMPKAAKMFIICSPVGPYYPEGFAPVKLLAESHYARAWPGGTGDSKIGGNYAPTIMPQQLAARKGFTQVLWLVGSEGFVSEVGTMNMFVLWKNDKGETELVTPPLDGTILPGVTRQSILELAREWNEFKVSERPFTMTDLTRAVNEGRMLEAFGAGTAAVVSPVKLIHYKDMDYKIPLDEAEGVGKVTKRFFRALLDIQTGKVDGHPWSVLLE